MSENVAQLKPVQAISVMRLYDSSKDPHNAAFIQEEEKKYIKNNKKHFAWGNCLWDLVFWCLACKQGEDVKLIPCPSLLPRLEKDVYMLYHATFMFYLTEKSIKPP